MIEIKTGDDIETKAGDEARAKMRVEQYLLFLKEYMANHGDVPLSAHDISLVRMAFETGYMEGGLDAK
jgi:hypothetical protein